ncbi:MAG: T9SS type A sorting domain-containing protein, partial [Bacteroidota bacterium]
ILFCIASLHCAAQLHATNYGYTDKSSYRSGETVVFYTKSVSGSTTTSFTLYNLDHSQTSTIINGFSTDDQPNLPNAANEPWKIGFQYQPTNTWIVPPLSATFKSGYYLLDNKIPIIIKGDNTSVDNITIVCATNTINAYTASGGHSLYDAGTTTTYTTVSFQRPQYQAAYAFSDDGFLDWVRTYAANHNPVYHLNFISDMDMDDWNEIASAKLLILPGHSEYWTRQARLNFDRFVDAGKDALILSGDTQGGQVRYEDQFGVPDNTKLTVYRGAYWGSATGHFANDPILSTDPLHYTCQWGAPFLKYSIRNSIGSEFIRGGYGHRYISLYNYTVDSHYHGFHLIQDNTQSPLLANTSLQIHDVVSIPPSYEEYDGTLIKTNMNGQPLDANGNLITDATIQDPVLDISALGFYRGEIVGYDYGEPYYVDPHVYNPDNSENGNPHYNHRERCYYPLMVFKKTFTSGTIVNVNSSYWCNNSDGAWTTGSPLRPTITANMINLVMQNQSLFSSLTPDPNFIIVSPAYTSVSYSACSGGSITFTPHGIFLDQAYKIDNGYTWEDNIWTNTTYHNGINGDGLQPFNNNTYNLTSASVDNTCLIYQARLANSANPENDKDNQQNDELNFSLYPNPATGKFNLQIQSANKEEKNISILNSIGQEIFHKEKFTDQSTAIDLTSNPKGIYFVKITDGEKTITKKIVLL